MSERTPGQAAYEARLASVSERFGEAAEDIADPWNRLPDALRVEWDAAAQAALDAYGILTAVKAADGDTIVIAFSRPLDARTAHEIRERWTAGAPGVTLAIVDNVAAIKGRQP